VKSFLNKAVGKRNAQSNTEQESIALPWRLARRTTREEKSVAAPGQLPLVVSSFLAALPLSKDAEMFLKTCVVAVFGESLNTPLSHNKVF
jgi:hypothetical protein